jgi:hypothetical protein
VTGSLAIDMAFGLLYAFANANFLFPLATVSGSGTLLAFALGAGIELPIEKGSRWKVDLFAQALPLHVGGAYTYFGFGAGVGLRYVVPSGFTVAIKLPVFGAAVRVGRSLNGYDSSFRPGDSVGYYYLGGAMGLPVLSFGYRF